MAHLLIRCASLAVERLSPAVFAKDPSRGGEWPPQRRVRVQDVPRMSVTMSTWSAMIRPRRAIAPVSAAKIGEARVGGRLEARSGPKRVFRTSPSERAHSAVKPR